MQDPNYTLPKWWPTIPTVKPPRQIKGTAITVLGSGTSAGVPLIGCKCKVCVSADPKNTRLRASVVIQTGKTRFLIDTSPDLRQQCLTNEIFWIDAVLFTHPHADHIHGVDELRSFNFIMARHLPCYGNTWSLDTLRNRFDYIFTKTQEGGGKPQLSLHEIKKPMKIHGVKVVPLELIHGEMPVLGYRINDVAYITDCSYIPDRTLKLLKNLRILVLDCLRPQAHPTHLNIDAALEWAKRIGAKRTYFTHMSHDIEYRAFSKRLPRKMYPAYDGLTVKA